LRRGCRGRALRQRPAEAHAGRSGRQDGSHPQGLATRRSTNGGTMRPWLRIVFPKNYSDRQNRAGFLFVLPALLFFGSVFLLPLGQSIMYSFYKIAPGGAREFVGLRLYEKVLTDPGFWTAVTNTIQLLLFSVPATVVLALAAALGLNRIISLKWRNVWAAMYFLPF